MEDVLTPKLLAFDEHYLDYTGALRAARALREQIDWGVLREKTCHSPYARGFFALLEALDIIPGDDAPSPGTQIRVVGSETASSPRRSARRPWPSRPCSTTP